MKMSFTLVCLAAITSLLLNDLIAAEVVGVVEKEPAGIRTVKTDKGYMVPYKVELANKASFEMVPIPGGKFKLGSPASETGRQADEGPQIEVEIAPFWMGKCEVTWGEFNEYMNAIEGFQKPDGVKAIQVTDANRVDAVTSPSKLYEPTYVFEFGDGPSFPAVTMTQFSARQYTKWLSKRTELVYRLPNEMEWEYACRAGTTTAYSFGDDPKKLSEYAWTQENANEKSHPVGSKKPNPWGLYDMHGSVMEWTLDAYSKDRYTELSRKLKTESADSNRNLNELQLTNWPKEFYSRTLRGGCFLLPLDQARSASRQSDNKEWHETDADRPKSHWWFTDDPCRAAGFRIIRTLSEPTKEEFTKLWEIDNEATKESVTERLGQGRGEVGIPVPIKKPITSNKVQPATK